MLVIYLFQRYLNKKEDFKFENIWQNKILKRQRLLWYSAILYYFIAVGLITSIVLFGSDSLFFGIIVTLFTMFVYGVFFLRSVLTFIAINNQRFMNLRGGFSNEPFQSSGFNKDNVVG